MNIKNENELHVYFHPDSQFWTCEGKLGSYGLASCKIEAIKIALDVMRSCSFQPMRILVYIPGEDHAEYIITKVKQGKASSQFFQDGVS